MTVTPGLVTGAACVVGSVALFAFGRAVARRRPREEWLVSLGRILLGMAGVFLLLTATVLAKPDVTCGLVVAIDQASLTDVRGFTLRTADGTTVQFTVDAARLAADSFVPGHLREHMAFTSPVCVSHAAGDILALDLRDESPSPSTAPSSSP